MNMRRAGVSLPSAAVVPLVVFFAITARPARLYAESAPPPPVCATSDRAPCDGLESGQACTTAGTAGTCLDSTCTGDAGENVANFACSANPTCAAPTVYEQACDGQTVGARCGADSTCDQSYVCNGADGKPVTRVACNAIGFVPDDAGADASSDAGDAGATLSGDPEKGCAVQSTGKDAGSGAPVLGFGLALAALARFRRRR